MNQQETFDTIVNHLRAQGRPARLQGASFCMYRAPDGTKCAAGVMIPDKLYSHSMEFKSIKAVVDREEYSELRDLLGDNVPIIQALQEIHDDNAVPNWEQGFEAVAHSFQLSYTPPQVQQ